ncbi:MAG: NAD(P)-dependent oxidoreductase [Isosphaeraceae bacterium]
MKVLVTGANGFLGRHVVAELARRGHSVRALVRPASRVESLGWPGSVEVARGDIRSPRGLAPAFEGVEALLHLAAAVTGGEDAQFAAAAVGTERLLEAAKGSGLRRVVLASSFSVYDWKRARGELNEATPVLEAPALYDRDGYAVAKVWQERVTRRACAANGWDLAVLRPGFIWGRDQGYLACLGQKFGPVHLLFAPTAKIPITHVENCAGAFVDALESPRAAGETFNVVDDQGVTAWRYLGDHLRMSHERGIRVPVPYFLGMTGARAARLVSRLIFRGKGKLPSLLVPCRFEARFKPLRFPNGKARDVLGWRPTLSYEEALTRTYGPEPAPETTARTPEAAHV